MSSSLKNDILKAVADGQRPKVMRDTLSSRIVRLITDGYWVSFRPDVRNGCIEIRLTENNHNISRVIDPDAYKQSYAFASTEEWLLYNLTMLEFELIDYVRAVEKGVI